MRRVQPAAAARLREILRRWEGLVADCLRRHGAAAHPRDDKGELTARDGAAVLVEAGEGAAMRGKIEGSRAPYERFEHQTLPRLLDLTVAV